MSNPTIESTNDKIAKIKGLFMQVGMSLNGRYYTEEAVKNMVDQINQQAENVKNGVEGQQYITMNVSHFTDEVADTVGRVISATYEDGQAYYEGELFLDTEMGKMLYSLIQKNAVAHVSIYGYTEPEDVEYIKTSDVDGYYEVKKVNLMRIDFTKTPGVSKAFTKIQASKQNKIVIQDEIKPNINSNGGIMEKEKQTELEERAKNVILQEEIEKKQKELQETKAQVADLQKKVEELSDMVKEQKDVLQKAYEKIDGYMLEAYVDEIKATKGWSDSIVENVFKALVNEKSFSSKELDTEKRYIEFKEFYKPIVEKTEKIVEAAKKAVEIKEDNDKEEEEVKENKDTKVKENIDISYLL